MAETEDPKDFQVVDRRASAAAGEAAPKAEPGKPVEGPGWKMEEAPADKPLPPMDFTTFCLSLASSAMIHLGVAPHPETGKTQTHLPLAQQTIDILALLEEKTRNNLTAEESRLLSAVLYDLRLRFVEARCGPTPKP